ncbi:uncharacterized protein LOC121391263, partial [Gigantopelta aegis]|uniref:uncharacterized protein LOC121391263 n=1 Tax=Gigantopelta aegis TaxID=1735272 RepID=UPI001B88B03E
DSFIGENQPKKEDSFTDENQPKKEDSFIGENQPKKEDSFTGENQPKKEDSFTGENQPKKEDSFTGENQPKKDDSFTGKNRYNEKDSFTGQNRLKLEKFVDTGQDKPEQENFTNTDEGKCRKESFNGGKQVFTEKGLSDTCDIKLNKEQIKLFESPNMKSFFIREMMAHEYDLIFNKNDPSIEIDGMSQHGHESDSVIKNQKMAVWYSPNGVCVVYVKGDMWKMKADVLLCPVHDATQNLQELIPADFLKGEEFSQCQKCVRSLDKKTVEFVQVKNQRCKCLAFTLIPRPQNKKCKTVSIDTINQIFKEVMNKNFTSIALPTIVDVQLVIQCVKDLLCTKSSQQILKYIYILLENDHELQYLKSVMDKKCNNWDMAGIL